MEEQSLKVSDIRFTMEEGSSIFEPIKENLKSNNIISKRQIQIPKEHNTLILYLNYLKEKNFDEDIDLKTHSLESVNSSNEKTIKKKKIKKNLNRAKSIPPSFYTNASIQDKVVDLNLESD